MKHERVTHPSDYNCGPYGCNVCNLFICSMCGAAEGTLTSDCPCYEVPLVMQELVYAGAIDFVVDQWITKDESIELKITKRKD